MVAPIARLYADQATAQAAQTALQSRGFSPELVQVVALPSPLEGAPTAEAPPDPALVRTITAAGLPPAHARIYAAHIAAGKALVLTQPPFGFGQTAGKILAGFAPIPVRLPAVVISATPRSNAAPLSTALGLPVLSSDPAPLSTALGWRTVKPQPATSKTLTRIQAQSGDAAPLSRKLKLAVLASKAAPLSGALKLGLLSSKSAPLSRAIKFPILWRRAAPVSAKLKLKVLSDDPAPLSTRFGWRVLSDNPAPLSTALGLPVLSKKD